MVVFLIPIGVVCLHFFLHNWEQVKIAEYTLEMLLHHYMDGQLSEKDYHERREKVLKNFTYFQRVLYNRRHGANVH